MAGERAWGEKRLEKWGKRPTKAFSRWRNREGASRRV